MSARSSGRRARHPWLTWGVPVAVLVLLAAAGSGAAWRSFYGTTERPASPRPTAGGQQPGPGTVKFSQDARNHPDFSAVRKVLQAHFDAINSGDYDRWETTVVAAKRRELPRETWRNEYESTRDGTIRVHRIEPGPDQSLRVLLTFTSTQDPANAPLNEPAGCLRWQAVYPLTSESGVLLLDTSRYPGGTRYERC